VPQPFRATIAGNHESECHSPACLVHLKTLGRALSNFSAFNARWAMPSAESRGVLNMWYSFDLGPLHVISLNSETDWPGADEQHTGDSHIRRLPAGEFGREGEYMAWLEADLRRAADARDAGSGRPWIIAGGHRPFEGAFASAHGALFQQYGVDAYFAGHSHSYTRAMHTFNDTTTMLSVVVGGAGCDEMKQAAKTGATGMGLASFHTKRYAAGVLRANSTALRWQLLDSEDGELLDEILLSK